MDQTRTKPKARAKTSRSRARLDPVCVSCIAANVHLGDGRVLRRGESCEVSPDLARRLRAKGVVE